MIIVGLDENANLHGEEWAPVPEWEVYEVSTCGRVRRKTQGNSPIAKPSIRKQSTTGRYNRVTLTDGGRRKSFSTHRLMLIAFVGPPPSPIHQCDHYDGDTKNNQIGNLRWVLPSENYENRRRLGNDKIGCEHPNSRFNQNQIDAIRKIKGAGASIDDIAVALGAGYSTIQRIVSGVSYNDSDRS
jgi:hypothetical protein